MIPDGDIVRKKGIQSLTKRKSMDINEYRWTKIIMIKSWICKSM